MMKNFSRKQTDCESGKDRQQCCFAYGQHTVNTDNAHLLFLKKHGGNPWKADRSQFKEQKFAGDFPAAFHFSVICSCDLRRGMFSGGQQGQGICGTVLVDAADSRWNHADVWRFAWNVSARGIAVAG